MAKKTQRCGTCQYFNGEPGDDVQFCDKRETETHEDNYCERWLEKQNEDMENACGAYALYEFLKELIESGELKAENDDSEIYFTGDSGISEPITDYSFDDSRTLMFW